MKRRNIPNPNQILQSKNTALVVVKAFLPPLVDKGERFDVDIRVPGQTNESGVQSLNGGYLLETYLSEMAFVPVPECSKDIRSQKPRDRFWLGRCPTAIRRRASVGRCSEEKFLAVRSRPPNATWHYY